jgi:hypothetical protein
MNRMSIGLATLFVAAVTAGCGDGYGVSAGRRREPDGGSYWPHACQRDLHRGQRQPRGRRGAGEM